MSDTDSLAQLCSARGCAALSFLLATSFAHGLMVQGNAGPPQVVPHVAVPAGAAVDFPIKPSGAPAPGDFEYFAVLPGTVRRGPNFGGAGPWDPWTMDNLCGIAYDGSNMRPSATNPPAPEGKRVAFVQKNGVMSTTFIFDEGTSRLRFQAAQRYSGGEPNSQRLRIEIGGQMVLEFEPESEQYATYTTRALFFDEPTQATITIQGLTASTANEIAFLDDMKVEPISDWDDPMTWSTSTVPAANSEVTIPANSRVALRGDAEASQVLLQGELMTSNHAASLETHWLMVMGSDAYFEVGREGTPFLADFDLILKGDASSPPAPHGGTKALVAMDGGRVDLHGVDKTSWTKLVSMQPAGDAIEVAKAAGWAVGDNIVVAWNGHISQGSRYVREDAPSVYSQPSYTEPLSQVRTIAAINGNQVSLSAPVEPFDHKAPPTRKYSDGDSPRQWKLDARTEVGVLTRNITIRTAEPASTFGGHVMIMSSAVGAASGFARISNVELFRLGQEAEIGRYPMHWHMNVDGGDGQYFRNSSVWQSQNRAVTVHGTNGVEVSDNVCFDILGHAMFLEDGVEERNRFERNLVLGARKSSMLLHDKSLDRPQNRSPAGFWISHPNNSFVDNVVADSEGCGYWFALHTEPTGLSAGAWSPVYGDLDASEAALPDFAFVGNVAHSVKMGLDVHDHVNDKDTPPVFDDDIEPNGMWRPSGGAAIKDFVAYGCTSGIYTGGGIEPIGNISFTGCVLVDNGVHMQFASHDTLSDSVFVYDSGNLIFPTGMAGNGMPDSHVTANGQGSFADGNAYVIYDGPARMRDCHLVGYSGPMGHSVYYSEFGAARRHADHRVSGLTFEGAGAPVIAFRDYEANLDSGHPRDSVNGWGFTIVDEDGSFGPLSLTHPTLIGNHPMVHLDGPGGTPDVQLSATAWLSPYAWSHLQVQYRVGGTKLEGLNIPTAEFTRLPYQGANLESFEDLAIAGGQIRQTPVIVAPDASDASDECTYVVALSNASPLGAPDRADLMVDDFYVGDVARIIVYIDDVMTWSPQVFVNDTADIYSWGSNYPSNALTAVGSQALDDATTTAFFRTTYMNHDALEIRMVKPSSPYRAHRVSLTW